MNNELLYNMIFKRKSFHLFRNIGKAKLTNNEINNIKDVYKILKPLVSDIKTTIKIVPADTTNCKRGEEYCILFYSEKKDNYLQNIGYLGEQLDLYLVSKNIATLWFGIGKIKEIKYNDLEFVIMLAICKADDSEKFRKDMYKSKRKILEEIWLGNYYQEIGNIVRFAPSACNTQPWIVESDEKKLKIYRYEKRGKRGIMPKNAVTYYNRIDMGIFLLFLDLCLEHNKISYAKKVFIDNFDDSEKILFAEYFIN